MIMGNFVGDLNLKKYEDYINVFDALSHPARIKIIGILAEGRQYVSELARLVNISRPLLYMHCPACHQRNGNIGKRESYEILYTGRF